MKYSSYFYCKNLSGEQIILDAIESKHCSQVLRKKAGDLIAVTDGNGNIAEAKLIASSKTECIAHIVQVKKAEKTYSSKVHVGIGSPSHPQRTEWMIEKLTELGVDEISLLKTAHVQFSKTKPDRLEKVMLSAVKQSMQPFLPKLHTDIKFQDFLKKWKQAESAQKIGFIGSCAPDAEPLKKAFKSSGDYFLLIGPEGDFSEAEYAAAFENGFIPISLGNNRLRVETAALSLLNAIHVLH